MKIIVLGTGCSKCKTLYDTVVKVAEALNVETEITKQEDMAEILKYNVMTLPALVIDENVVAKGQLNAEQVSDILKKHL